MLYQKLYYKRFLLFINLHFKWQTLSNIKMKVLWCLFFCFFSGLRKDNGIFFEVFVFIFHYFLQHILQLLFWLTKNKFFLCSKFKPFMISKKRKKKSWSAFGKNNWSWWRKFYRVCFLFVEILNILGFSTADFKLQNL